jgi:glycosyltransferase involved in cell wall biosynthesis
MNNLAPVVLFTYKRLPTLKRSVESLLSNKECLFTDLIIYSDGPKTENDRNGVEEVRSYLKTLQGFKSIKYIFREKNLGLAESFIQGITETLNQHECAIFLEDDNFLSPYFLSFMNKALEHYKDNEKVICVSGFSQPIKNEQKEPYFLRGAETWSMGTWRRGWKYFCADAKILTEEIQNRGLLKKFREDGFGFHETLQNHIRGRVNSWGVRWWASAFVNDMYCFYPHVPLCVSIGFGVDSVHNAVYSPGMRNPGDLSKYPIDIFPDIVTEKKEVSIEIKRMNKALPHQKIINAIKRFPSRIKNKIVFEYKKIND